MLLLNPPQPPQAAPALLSKDGPVEMDSVGGRPAAMIQTQLNPDFLRPGPLLSPGRAVLHAKPQRLCEAPAPEDLFTLAPDAASKAISAYLTSKDFFHAPRPFRAIQVGENALAYNKERRGELVKLRSDKLPWIIRTHLIPPVLRSKDYIQSPPPPLSALPAEHLQAVKDLIHWHQGARGWTGFWALSPRPPILDCCRYGVPDQPDPCASILEIHRRIIELERALNALAMYIHEVAVKTKTIRQLSRNHITAAHGILSAGCGIWGKGFWTCPPPDSAAVQKLSLFEPPAKPLLEAPAGLRDLEHAYPLLSELDWGLPLLALYRANPMDREDPAAFLAVLRSDEEDRRRVYMEALKPRLLYGGLLSRYVQGAFDVAKAFESLNEPGISFPRNCRLCAVNDKGFMVGPDGSPIAAGHMQFAPGKAPPIPFPASCLAVKPLPSMELAGVIAARRQKESAAIDGLLSSLGISSSVVVEARNRAIKTVDDALRTDTHRDNRTDFLQPTASMMEAVHTPSMMYGM